jgi:excisionase family DNA binding protein
MPNLGIPETARRLGISRQAVHSAIRRGIIHAERDGYYWRISEAEVDRLMGPEEIARRQKYLPRKEERGNQNDNTGAAYGGRQGLTANRTSTTNRRGA